MRNLESRPDGMTGEMPINNPNRRLYADPGKGLFSCWGIQATGPQRQAVLSGTIGTRKHAEQELEKWKKNARGLQLKLIHLDPGKEFTKSMQWGRLPPFLIRRVHGLQNKGNIKADGRKCKD